MRRSVLVAVGTIVSGAAMAESPPILLNPLTVEGQAPSPSLTQENRTGSYVGLTPMETPAAVNIITQEEMQEKGLRNLIEVYNSAPGVVSGNLPGEPSVTTMRGFSRAATGFSVDGARAVDPLLVARNYDSYNFERVEILKGPASVIHGTGALAGAVNLVTKQPMIGKSFVDGLASYGSFDTVRGGAGFNHSFGPSAAVRTSLSYAQSDGYVDDTDSRTIGLTSGAVMKPMDRLSISASIDYFHDKFTTPYQGAPLIPSTVARDASDVVSAPNGMVIDESLRDRNYNVSDGLMKSDTIWLRLGGDYKLTGDWSIKNELNFYNADRFWANSEDFTYNTGTGLLDRSTTLITHDHQFWSNRLMLAQDGALGSFRNRFAGGYEFITTDFGSRRRFGSTTSVDPFNPDRGVFPSDTPANFGTRQDFDSKIDTHAAFVEDALNLTPDWLFVGGVRYERIALDREIEDVTAGTTTRFGRDYNSLSWRVGTVYNVTPGIALFAQYNQAVIPITTLLLSNTSRAGFDLSTGQSVEAGVKSSLWKDRAVVTASVYQVEQDDILTRDPTNPSLTVQGGSQRTRGVEAELSVAATDQWRVGVNGTLMDVEFTDLTDASGNNQSGNRPPNVPSHIVNFFSTYRLKEIPMTFGVGVRHVGSTYTDNANSIKVASYTLLDASVGYDVGGGTVRVRGRNLTDAFYADWSGYSSSQVYIGAPRSFDVTYSIKF